LIGGILRLLVVGVPAVGADDAPDLVVAASRSVPVCSVPLLLDIRVAALLAATPACSRFCQRPTLGPSTWMWIFIVFASIFRFCDAAVHLEKHFCHERESVTGFGP
jgi:hypothetical protein